MGVIGTTTLVSLYTKVIFDVSEKLEVDFYAFYACVGIFSTILVLIYSLFGFSFLIKYCTRSIAELYSAFIMICFAYYSYVSCKNSKYNN